MTKRHKKQPPKKCVNCGQNVKGSNLRRHQRKRCPTLKRLTDRDWHLLLVVGQKTEAPGFIVREAGAPYEIYYVGKTVQTWVPKWVHEIAATLPAPTYQRIALLKASNEDTELRHAIYAAIVAGEWEVAEDLLPEPWRPS